MEEGGRQSATLSAPPTESIDTLSTNERSEYQHNNGSSPRLSFALLLVWTLIDHNQPRTTGGRDHRTVSHINHGASWLAG